ncbi:MAG: uracil-DNA glycosylase family protein, partial [Rhodobacter sp.]|nr:uracil-DNA glycosylase family protein [Rhodobacter sp.]
AQGADLPPPPICAKSWHASVMAEFGQPDLMLLVGGYAHKWHLQAKTNVTDTTKGWRDHAPRLFPLPHPSWRNTGWLKANPWFHTDLLPDLRQTVQHAMQAKDT